MDARDMYEGQKVRYVGELPEGSCATGKITVLSDDPTIPDGCKVLFDDGVEDVLSAPELEPVK